MAIVFQSCKTFGCIQTLKFFLGFFFVGHTLNISLLESHVIYQSQQVRLKIPDLSPHFVKEQVVDNIHTSISW